MAKCISGFADFLDYTSLPHLCVKLQLLQLPLVGPLAEGFVDLGHDGNLFAAVVEDQLAFGLGQIAHET